MATYFRFECCFVGNLTDFPATREIFKIWQHYRHNSQEGGSFFETQCVFVGFFTKMISAKNKCAFQSLFSSENNYSAQRLDLFACCVFVDAISFHSFRFILLWTSWFRRTQLESNYVLFSVLLEYKSCQLIFLLYVKSVAHTVPCNTNRTWWGKLGNVGKRIVDRACITCNCALLIER